MDPVLIASSPFLQDTSDFHPTSASSSNHFDVSHPGSPYDGFTIEHDFGPDHTQFPHTPSYNGSYQNSPFSVTSELPTYDNADGSDYPALYSENAHTVSINDEYDPSEYDLPNSGSLLTFDDRFMNSAEVSVSITPPVAYDQSSPQAYDHSSPASSAGGEDGRRSRASSTSSYIHPNSPPLDFAKTFERGLHFESPAWRQSQLPSDRTSPPAQKPQSPPQLLIPESPAMSVHDEPPTINAPEGDGTFAGPQLHIVPATPISGGGGSAQPFLQQGGSRESSTSHWDQTQRHLTPVAANQGIPSANQFTDQSQSYYTGSNSSSAGMAFANSSVNSSASSTEQSRHQHYLVPQIPVARSRSLSDTSLRPPVWDTAPMPTSGSAIVDTVHMNDVLPGPGSASPSPSPVPSQRHPSSAGPHQASFGHSFAPPRMPNYSFGGPHNALSPHLSTDYLSPEVSAASLRRVKSESIRQFGHRQSRSEDFRYSSSLAATTASNAGMYPPPGGMSQEYISRQFLHPTQSVIPSIAARTGHRRSSSTSRERPMGWNSNTSSARASPYPSPSASPRPGYGALPGADYPPMGIMRHPLGVEMGLGLGMAADDAFVNVAAPGQPEHKIPVSKVNVTTPSTADASQKRRKQPANFQCPVPGCGSTFTRHFNLKGHLRSHAEEKPYQCKWPGCGKGFARQHDCKRHENLHLNIRPYPCEGCKKNFARMDALNRHLRSEGGAECRKIQKEMKPSGDELDMSLGAVSLTMKQDPDDKWAGSVVM